MRSYFLIVSVLFFSGCGGSHQSAPPVAQNQAYYAMAAQTDAEPSATGTALGVGGGGESEGVDSSQAVDAPKTIRPPTEQRAAEIDVEEKLVKSGSMTLEIDDDDDFEKTIRKIADIAKAQRGYVFSESRKSILIKVPTEALDETLAKIKKLGDVTEQNISVTDVTANYVDMQIRIDNLRRLRTRLNELLVQGSTVIEVLEVEKELARVTRELEQMEGQIRVLQNQVSYATLTISIKESISPGPIGWIFYNIYRGVKWLFVWD